MSHLQKWLFVLLCLVPKRVQPTPTLIERSCSDTKAGTGDHILGVGNQLATAGRRCQFESPSNLSALSKEEWLNVLEQNPSKRPFPRFASAGTIARLFDRVRHPSKSFRKYRGEDGRHGLVSSTNLGRGWVLAESKQVAVGATPSQVLKAYLSGKLQTQWNADTVLNCEFTLQPSGKDGPHYRQDLRLRSQRVIRRHTGVMQYAQCIALDQVGSDAFCAYVTLDTTKPPGSSTTTALAPFTALHVNVLLEAQGNDTYIYAAGLFCVNRRVVPNLVIFDAAGIAGTMAGKGTLWLAAHFRNAENGSSSTAVE